MKNGKILWEKTGKNREENRGKETLCSLGVIIPKVLPLQMNTINPKEFSEKDLCKTRRKALFFVFRRAYESHNF